MEVRKEDLHILCSEDAKDWANYFRQQLPDRLVTVSVMDAEKKDMSRARATVLMVIVSPEFVKNCPQNMPSLRRMSCEARSTIAAFCGMEATDGNEMANDIPSYVSWKKLIITGDFHECERNVSVISETVLKYSNYKAESKTVTNTKSTSSVLSKVSTEHICHEIVDKFTDSLTSKKPPPPLPKRGQGKVCAPNVQSTAASSPLHQIRPKNERFSPALVPQSVPSSRHDVLPSDPLATLVGYSSNTSQTMTSRGPLPSTTTENITIFPREVRHQDEVLIIFNGIVMRPEAIEVQIENRTTNHRCKLTARMKQLNIYTLSLKDVDLTSGVIHVDVYSDGDVKGAATFMYVSATDQLNKLLDSLINPVQVLCDVLGVDSANVVSLDEVLASRLTVRTPQKLCSSFKLKKADSLENNKKELPTLFHMAAKFGLEKLTTRLLKLPGSHDALNITNCHGKTPMEIASDAGHDRLVEILDDVFKRSGDDIYRTLIGLDNDQEYMPMTLSGQTHPYCDTYVTAPTPPNDDSHRLSWPKPGAASGSGGSATTGEQDNNYMDMTLGRGYDVNRSLYMDQLKPPYMNQSTISEHLMQKIEASLAADSNDGQPPLEKQKQSAETMYSVPVVTDESFQSRRRPAAHINTPISSYYSTSSDSSRSSPRSSGGLPSAAELTSISPAPPPRPERSDRRPSADDVILGRKECDAHRYGSPTSGPSNGMTQRHDAGDPLPSRPLARRYRRPSVDDVISVSAAAPVYNARHANDIDMTELLRIQEDFKNGQFTEAETHLRFQMWMREHKHDTLKERKGIIKALKSKFSKKPNMTHVKNKKKDTSSSTARRPELPEPNTCDDRRGSTLSNTSATSGTSSRSSGISLSAASENQDCDDVGHLRVVHRRPDGSYPLPDVPKR